MTVRQLAERLGVQVKDLRFEFDSGCKNCKNVGGSEPPGEGCVNLGCDPDIIVTWESV